MRGKVPAAVELDFSVGITPAYAGKRTLTGGKISLTVGSPPPMRGKDLLVHSVDCIFRITPAYAGKSSFRI